MLEVGLAWALKAQAYPTFEDEDLLEALRAEADNEWHGHLAQAVIG
jgi:hypothetical protein